MKQKFVAVDTGKYATKVAIYHEEVDKIRKFHIRSAYCEGDFRDDAVEENTVIIQADTLGDQVYKVGNGARGIGAELTTSKMLEVHRICAITALANVASKDDVDEFYVATLLPAKDWAAVSKREDFREFLLPEGDVHIKIKGTGNLPIVEKHFIIKKRYVFPESIGALFMDEVIDKVSPTSVIGVLDIGNLNLNATLWQGKDLVQDKSSTAELGGSILIQEIAQEISTHVTTCDEMIAASILTTGTYPECMSKEQQEEIANIVSRIKKQHAEKIKRTCHSRNWSLEMIPVVAIGGTAKDLSKELREVFGDNLILLENSKYINVMGGLRMMCARELDKLISLEDVKNK